MYISLDWIKKYTDIKTDTNELIEMIRRQIGEVEKVIDYKEIYDGIYIGEITEKSDVKGSDKLARYQVSIGKDIDVQVVAGDRALEVGDKVAYIQPGSKVPHNPRPDKHDGVIRKVKLAGVESNGMLASAKELGLSNDHESVMVLDTDLDAGTKFTDYIDFDDIVIEIENKALANRADCFGILGIAREVAGVQQIPFTSPAWYLSPDTGDITQQASLPIHIHNEAGELCKRFMAVSIDEISVKPSPLWMQALLIKSGIRPINNVVDITNYMMLLTGLPLHAYDYDKLKAKDKNAEDQVVLKARPANDGEKLTTLDGKTVELDSSVVVITDSTNPVGVGGVMGGLDTEIDDDTTRIVLECAIFDKYNIRKTSMKLGLFTEAVTRYTKGQDPERCPNVLYKALELLNDHAGGVVASDIMDDYKNPDTPRDIMIHPDTINHKLGTQITAEDIKQILDNVELYSTNDDDGNLHITIPSYRSDLEIQEDIVEEVGRLYGYLKVPLNLPSRTIHPVTQVPVVQLQKALRKEMLQLGANEVLTYNFTSIDSLELFEQSADNAYRITNSLSPELEYMRMSIAPSIIEKLDVNIRKGHEEVAIFEINKTHNKLEVEEELPIERLNLAYAYTTTQDVDGSPYYQAKIILDSLLDRYNAKVSYKLLADLSPEEIPTWIKNIYGPYDVNSSAIAYLTIGDQLIELGIVGTLKKKISQTLKLPQYIAIFEISVNELLRIQNQKRSYHEPSKYPAVSNDVCFILDEAITYGSVSKTIKDTIHAINPDLRATVSYVDIYQTPDQSEQMLKQITYRIETRSDTETLENDYVNQLLTSVIEKVNEEFDAELKE